MFRVNSLQVKSEHSDGRLRIQHVFPEKGRTKQSFREECDINFIMKRYTRTGRLPELIRTDGKYGDYSNAGDFREAQDIICHAKEQFSALSSRQRERFNNDPARFLDFMNDRSNEDEARKLGFLKPKAPDTVPKDIKGMSVGTKKSSPKPKAEGADKRSASGESGEDDDQ